jgi:hypothetical protein
LIIAFVVVVWAAYFIPLALRRYDEAGKNASVETSGTLSRVITRPTSAAKAAPEGAEPVETATPVAPAAPSRAIDRPAARLAARRRRRTLLTLVALTVVVAGLAALGVLPAWAIAVPVVLDIAWLVACRVQVRGELGLSAPKISAPKMPRKRATATASDEEDTIIVSGQLEDIDPARKHEMENVALEHDALDDQIVIAVPTVSTTGEALWDPLPVTLPTYVTKPRAGRTVRTIDFSQPGTWTSGHIEGEDVELPKRDSGAEEPRRAVGH